MTTKEEVLRLCETVGIKFTNCRTLKEPLFLSNGSQKFEVFTALIDLAKQADYSEEQVRELQLAAIWATIKYAKEYMDSPISLRTFDSIDPDEILKRINHDH